MTATVSTRFGDLLGRRVSLDGTPVSYFGGVPYAEPPLDDRRFELPAELAPWAGVRDASRPGPAPAQIVADTSLVPDMAVADISEDCLTAEVWSPDTSGSSPVLVWIPGGQYQIGGAGLATYEGARLAAENNLVVVGLNYRLGVFGFMTADEIPGNLGLHDLIAALRWIRENIADFGGDPSRVTVMGESAGAGAISHLLVVPDIDQLISGAIVQSAAPGATLSPDTAGLVAQAVLDAAQVSDSAALKRLSTQELLSAQGIAVGELLSTVGMMPLHPVADGRLLACSPLDAARTDRLAAVPLLIGTTNNEMELFRSAVPELPPEYSERFLLPKLEKLRVDGTTVDDVRCGLAAVNGSLVEAIADLDLHVPAGILAREHARRGLPVHQYRFDWQAPDIGAAHAVDLPFTFGTLDVATWRKFVGADGPDAEAANQLSDRMRQAFAEFAASAAPACDPIGRWPRQTADGSLVVQLGRDVEVVDDPGRKRFDAWLG